MRPLCFPLRTWMAASVALIAGLRPALAEKLPESLRLSLDAASIPAEFHINAGSSGYEGAAWSLNPDPVLLPDLYFTVDRHALGLSGSPVSLQAPAGADIFVRKLGGDLGLYAGAFELGLQTGFFGDHIDALECRIQAGQDAINQPSAYNTIWRASSMIGSPVHYPNGPGSLLTPADILIGMSDVVFATHADVGLLASDGLDALILLDVTPDPDEDLGFRFEPDGVLQPGLDLALFSLDPFSPTVNTGGGANPAYTPGTVFLTRFDGTFNVLLSPEQLGLTEWDNLAALSFVPEPASALLFAAGALVLFGRRRLRLVGREVRAVAVALLVVAGGWSITPPAAADAPMRRYCGDSPPVAGSRASLGLNWNGGQVTFSVQASDPGVGVNDPDQPGSLVLPPQTAAQATVLPNGSSEPQKIIFSHSAVVDGLTLKFYGDVNVGAAGSGTAILDVQIVEMGQTVRYLMGDVSLIGFQASLSPPSSQVSVCAGEQLHFDIKIEPFPKLPASGTWQVVGLPAHLYAVEPASGNWIASDPNEMVLVPFKVRQLQPHAEAQTMTIVVTGELGAGCYPIEPVEPPYPASFVTPAVTCVLRGEKNADPELGGGDVFFETGESAKLWYTVRNPCTTTPLTGTLRITGGEGAYDTPHEIPIAIPPFGTLSKPVTIKNLAAPGGPVEFAMVVTPVEALVCNAPRKVKANFEPPKIIRVSSLYTESRADGQGTVHGSYLAQVTLEDTFEVEVDWRDHAPGQVRFEFGPQAVLVPAGGPVATTSYAMQLLPLDSKVHASAIGADGTQSKPLAAALDVVKPPVWLPPVPLVSPTGYVHKKKYTTAAKRELKYANAKVFSVLMDKLVAFSSNQAYKAISKVLGGQGLSWIPKVESKIEADGSSKSASVSIAIKTEKSAKDKEENDKVKAKALPKIFGLDFEKVAGVLKKMGWKFSVTVTFGTSYKIKADETAWKQTTGDFGLGGEVAGSIPPKAIPFVVAGVPCYFQGNVGLAANVGVKVPLLNAPEDVKLSGTFGITPKGGFKLGAGADKIAAIEGSVGLEVPVTLKAPPQANIGYLDNLKVALKGSVKLVTFLFEYGLIGGECFWQLRCPSPNGPSCGACNFGFGGFMPMPPRPIGRDYLGAGFARFHGGGLPLEPTRGVTNMVVENELRHAQPDLTSSGTTRLLAWITDDPERGPANRSRAVFSRADGDSWSAPAPIDDDGTADFNPQIRGVGNDGSAMTAWNNSAIALPDDSPFDALLEALEISVASYSGPGNAWSAPVRLTNNDHLDHKPRLAVAADGTAVVVWVANPWNHIFGTAAQPNSILYSLYDGDSWSSPAVAAAEVPHVGNLSVAFNGTEAVIAYCGDDDGFFDPDADEWDIELYSLFYDGVGWGAPTRVTFDEELDSAPSVVYEATNTPLFVWNSGGRIVSARQLDLSDLVEVVPEGLASASSVLAVGADGAAALVWPTALDTAADLAYAFFDPYSGTWAPPGRMTNDNDYEEWVSATIDADGRLHAAYMSERVTFSTDLVEFDGETYEVQKADFQQADLLVSSMQFNADLAADSSLIFFDPEIPQAGEPLTIRAQIENFGDLAANDAQVVFYDGDPDRGGVQIGAAQTISGPLAGGEIAEVEVAWGVPDDGLARSVYVVVDPAGVVPDNDPNNNVASRMMLGPDLIIDSIVPLATDSCERTLTFTVVNGGGLSSPATTLVLRELNERGVVLAEFDVGPLAPEAEQQFDFVWVAPVFDDEDQPKLYAAVDEADEIVELDEDNIRVTVVDLVGLGTDCNDNGVADACDIAHGTSLDANGNGIPDECEIVYVNLAAGGDGSGRSWENAFLTLQDAIAAAEDSGGIIRQIWVAAGTYTPADPGGDREASFRLVDGVGIFGGFAGGETTLAARNLAANLTVLSGDLNGDDDGAGGGLVENAYHIVTADAVGATAVLDGFVILGGVADGAQQHGSGGGLWIENGGPTVRNCSILGCVAAVSGGGAFVSNSDARFVNCVFSGNLSAEGAGLYLFGGSVALANCTITQNAADGSGGGLWTGFGGVQVRGSILWDNSDADGSGEAAQLHVFNGAPAVNYCCVQGWTGGLGGAGNIGANPLFVLALGPDGLPGTIDDDVSLSFRSACIDAADNDALPTDVDDLNSNGNVDELLPIDRAGQPRRRDDPRTPDTGQGTPPIVDMGALEFQPAGGLKKPPPLQFK